MLQTGWGNLAYARRDMGKSSSWQHLGVPVDEARNPSYNALRLAVGDFIRWDLFLCHEMLTPIFPHRGGGLRVGGSSH